LAGGFSAADEAIEVLRGRRAPRTDIGAVYQPLVRGTEWGQQLDVDTLEVGGTPSVPATQPTPQPAPPAPPQHPTHPTPPTHPAPPTHPSRHVTTANHPHTQLRHRAPPSAHPRRLRHLPLATSTDPRAAQAVARAIGLSVNDRFSGVRTALRESALQQVAEQHGWSIAEKRAPVSEEADGMGNVTNASSLADHQAFATRAPVVVEVARLELEEGLGPDWADVVGAGAEGLVTMCAAVLTAIAEAVWQRGLRGGHGEVVGQQADVWLVQSAWAAAERGQLLGLLPWLLLSNRRPCAPTGKELGTMLLQCVRRRPLPGLDAAGAADGAEVQRDAQLLNRLGQRGPNLDPASVQSGVRGNTAAPAAAERVRRFSLRLVASAPQGGELLRRAATHHVHEALARLQSARRGGGRGGGGPEAERLVRTLRAWRAPSVLSRNPFVAALAALQGPLVEGELTEPVALRVVGELLLAALGAAELRAMQLEPEDEADAAADAEALEHAVTGAEEEHAQEEREGEEHEGEEHEEEEHEGGGTGGGSSAAGVAFGMHPPDPAREPPCRTNHPAPHPSYPSPRQPTTAFEITSRQLAE